jgi:hypothetical protein
MLIAYSLYIHIITPRLKINPKQVEYILIAGCPVAMQLQETSYL